MPEKKAPWNAFHIAETLRWRRNQGRYTVLMLGSRAGGLFRSEKLYDTLKQFGNPSFSSLPRIKQFGECYHILTRRKNMPDFSTTDINTILRDASKEIDITGADICLAELVKSGLFGIIVTTSMDNILEESLKYIGMKETHDFEVFRLEDSLANDKLQFKNSLACNIIKIFGKGNKQEYVVRRGGYLNRNQSIKERLAALLEQDVMVIGLDPVWDEEIHQAFRPQGNSFWFINEEEPEEHTLLSHIGNARNARYFLGTSADYEHFIPLLYSTFTKQTLSDSQVLEASSLQQSGESSLDQSDTMNNASVMQKSTNTSVIPRIWRRTLKIFISYAARNESLVDDLLEHMATLKHEKIIREWHNRKLQAGQVYTDEVDSHLNSADIILLLVSSSFIASDYIYSVELAQAMKLHNEGKAYVIPVILRPVDWEGMPFGGLTPLPTDGKPVTSWKDRDRAWLDIVQGIREVAKKFWGIA